MTKTEIIEALDLFSDVIEDRFNTVVLRKLFSRSSNDKPVYCVLFVPTDKDGFILEKDLKVRDSTFRDIIDLFKQELDYDFGDGGAIRMSYILDGTDREDLYHSHDNPIVEDIYERMDSVYYRKIEFYLTD